MAVALPESPAPTEARPTIRVENLTRGTILISHGDVARSFWRRFMGLMGHGSLPDGYGLVFLRENWVHMFFMRIPLDICHVDASGRVVRVVPNLKPWRIGPFVRHSVYLLELPAGTLERTSTHEGDMVRIDGLDTEQASSSTSTLAG